MNPTPHQSPITNHQSPDIEWSTSTLDNGGNLITVGNVLQGPGDADILVTKYDSHGALLWQESYDGPAGGLDYGLTLITDNQSAVYVAGVVTDTTGFYDMMLLILIRSKQPFPSI